ncbi:MAG: nicotinate phosphoribosyltransferase [candidate division KSB1 bacterium]|nr:nicotinate phosphoribosyltransferase [candidate division KSB1 bacterium]
MLHIAPEDDILAGKVTDVYFERTRQVLQAENLDAHVVAEFVVKKFPNGRSWGVFAGLEEAASLLEHLPIKVWSVPEGTVFRPHEPIFIVEGNYLDFGRYETAILGFFCQASGIATQAARCRIAAGERPVISFGARRMHPSIAPMIERNAYIGGCNGVATIKSAELLGLKPSGTVPHALILIMGDTVKAMKAFDQHIDPEVMRVALVDTFNDEKFEALRVAEELKDRLFAIRLDTPGSRRGDLVEIMREIRWELDLRGYEHIKIFLSGGLDERTILRYNVFADAYGVGTSLSNAPVLDFSMDLVEINGEPIAKRGKTSGRKDVRRCPKCFQSKIVPWGAPDITCDACQETMPSLLRLIWDGKTWLQSLPSADNIRQYVLEQLQHVSLDDIEATK